MYSTMLERKASLPSDELEVSVTDYYMVGDGTRYDQHYFVLTVNVENMKYSVDRSYVDFVEFDRKMRKIYPESNYPFIPLDAAAYIRKTISKDPSVVYHKHGTPLGAGQHTRLRNSVILTRDSFIRPASASYDGTDERKLHPLHIPPMFTELINSKVGALDQYLNGFLTEHELVISDELMSFLDEELPSICMTKKLDPLTTHDLLLINTPINKVIVHRLEDYYFEIPPSHMIVWRFTTKHFDIGFSVEINGEIKVPYTRYKSHEVPVYGTLEAENSSVCMLKFDNSYAKFRTKHLSWSAKVVSRGEYQAAKAQAIECQREVKRFELQRNAVKRASNKIATKISGIIHDSSVETDQVGEDLPRIKELEHENEQLKDALNAMAEKMQRLEMMNSDLQIKKRTAEESRDHISNSWRFSVQQYETVQTEMKQYKRKTEVLLNDCTNHEKEIAELQQLLDEQQQNLYFLTQKQTKLSVISQHELKHAELDKMKWKRQATERDRKFSSILSIEKNEVSLNNILMGKSTSSPISENKGSEVEREFQYSIRPEDRNQILQLLSNKDLKITLLTEMINNCVREIQEREKAVDSRNVLINDISSQLNNQGNSNER